MQTRVLTVLVVVYIFNFVDRNLMSMLIDSIKRDLDVSDSMMGLLVGPAFALLYTIAGIPIARLADRYPRRLVLAIGLTVWSIATAELAREHNDANVVAFGARVIGTEVAREALKVFLNTPFEGGRHAGRVAKLSKG